MGFFDFLFGGGGGGGSSQTTTVQQSTTVTVNPQITNVVEVPLQKLIDALTIGQEKSDSVHALSAVAAITAAEAQAKTGAATAGAIQDFGKNILLAGSAIAAVLALQKWG